MKLLTVVNTEDGKEMAQKFHTIFSRKKIMKFTI